MLHTQLPGSWAAKCCRPGTAQLPTLRIIRCYVAWGPHAELQRAATPVLIATPDDATPWCALPAERGSSAAAAAVPTSGRAQRSSCAATVAAASGADAGKSGTVWLKDALANMHDLVRAAAGDDLAGGDRPDTATKAAAKRAALADGLGALLAVEHVLGVWNVDLTARLTVRPALRWRRDALCPCQVG